MRERRQRDGTAAKANTRCVTATVNQMRPSNQRMAGVALAEGSIYGAVETAAAAAGDTASHYTPKAPSGRQSVADAYMQSVLRGDAVIDIGQPQRIIAVTYRTSRHYAYTFDTEERSTVSEICM